MTVVVLVLDGVGARSVSPFVMPTLSSWGSAGLRRPQGASSAMCSSTYPNFASIVTGMLPNEHGIVTNQVVIDGERVAAADVGPRGPTLLDADTEVVVGDHNLIGVIGADSAGRHWPPSTRAPDGVELDMFGYVTDAEIADLVADALDRRPGLVFAQLNSPDTFAHVFGPDSVEAFDSYRAADSALELIGSAVQWEDDLVLVTSDHDQETIDPSRRVDLRSIADQRGIEVIVVEEGSAAMITGQGGADSSWLRGIPGVESWQGMGTDVTLVFSEPGWWFAHADFPDLRGAHGGPRTRSTVAVVAGPEPALEMIRSRFLAPTFGAEHWYGVIQTARGVDWKAT